MENTSVTARSSPAAEMFVLDLLDVLEGGGCSQSSPSLRVWQKKTILTPNLRARDSQTGVGDLSIDFLHWFYQHLTYCLLRF